MDSAGPHGASARSGAPSAWSGTHPRGWGRAGGPGRAPTPAPKRYSPFWNSAFPFGWPLGPGRHRICPFRNRTPRFRNAHFPVLYPDLNGIKTVWKQKFNCFDTEQFPFQNGKYFCFPTKKTVLLVRFGMRPHKEDNSFVSAVVLEQNLGFLGV